MYKLVAQNTEPFPILEARPPSQSAEAPPQTGSHASSKSASYRPEIPAHYGGRMPAPNQAMVSMPQATFPQQYPPMPRGYGSHVRFFTRPPAFVHTVQPVVVCPPEKLAELFPGINVTQVSKLGVADDRGCFWPWPQGYKPLEVPMMTGGPLMPVHPSMGPGVYRPPFPPFGIYPDQFRGGGTYSPFTPAQQFFAPPQVTRFQPAPPQAQQAPPLAQRQVSSAARPSGAATEVASRYSSTGSTGDRIVKMVEELLRSPVPEEGESDGGDDDLENDVFI
jgi:hypothetical protein